MKININQMKKPMLLLFIALILIYSCKKENPLNSNSNDISNQTSMLIDSSRLVFRLPNYEYYYSFSADQSRLNSNGNALYYILVSKTEMRALAENLSDKTIFRWEYMTAVSPYPKNECVLLLYGGLSEVDFYDYMCSIGNKDTAANIVEELAMNLTGDPKKAFIDIQNILLKNE